MKELPVIVTAFHDLQRGAWSCKFDMPSWVDRSSDIYHSYFKNLVRLENKIIVYSDALTTMRISDQHDNVTVKPLNASKITLPCANQAAVIQESDSYKMRIHQKHLLDPECRIAKYVEITNRKINFLKTTYEQLGPNQDYVWIDYGYFREVINLPRKNLFGNLKTEGKVTLFNLRNPRYFNLEKAITLGQVYLSGCMIYVPGHLMNLTFQEWEKAKSYLLEANLVDDDQTILLIMYLSNPKFYELIKMPDWNNRFERRSAFNSIKGIFN